MNIRTFAGSMKQTTQIVAISTVGSLFSLPALAGGTLSESMPKPSSAPMSAPTSPASAPSVSVPTVPITAPEPTSTSLPAATTSAPTSTPMSVSPSDPTSKPAASQTLPDPATKVTPTTTKLNEFAPSATETTKAAGTIVDVALSKGSFNTLVTAVRAAGLTDVLTGAGPYTVFAPTDEAFASLPKGTVEKLLKPENQAKLKKLLTYHVVSGAVKSTAIKPGQVKTVEGNSVLIKSMKTGLMVNNAKVMTPDINASNGVIHAIDKVILPPDL